MTLRIAEGIPPQANQPDLKKRKKATSSELAQLHPLFESYTTDLAEVEEFIEKHPNLSWRYIRKEVSNFGFTLMFDGEGNISIHGKGKCRIAKDSAKRVSLSIDYTNKTLYANAVCLLDSETKKLRASRESRFLNAVHGGPHIIRLLGEYEYPSKCGILKKGWKLQYYSNKDLFDWVMKHKLNNTQKMQIAKDIAEGLSFLHQKGILHRDLKLENILLDEDFRAYIADFDLAGKVGEVHHLLGSFGYVPPEAIKHRHQELFYTTQTDVYSFGILLYMLFYAPSSRPPGWNAQWKADWEQALVEMAIPIVGRKEYKEPFKDTIDWVIWKMLRYNPEDRYANGLEVLQALQRLETLPPACPSSKQKPDDN